MGWGLVWVGGEETIIGIYYIKKKKKKDCMRKIWRKESTQFQDSLYSYDDHHYMVLI